MIKNRLQPSHALLALFFLFWVVFAISFGLKQFSRKSSELPKIVKRGVIRVCGEEDPFSFYQDTAGSHGFQYEMAKAFADKYNLELYFYTEKDFNKRLDQLLSGKCDFLAGPLPILAELQKSIAYSEPILKSHLVLVQRKKNVNRGIKPIRDQIALGGKTITVTHNSPNIGRIHHLANEISDSIHIREYVRSTNKMLIDAVVKRHLDFVACDNLVAASFQKSHPEIDIKTNLGLTQYQAWAVRPSKSSLLDSLNSFISDYKKSPAFARLLKNYPKN